MGRKSKTQIGATSPKKENTIGGRSILADKVFESLQAILDAYEARLKPNQTQEERYRAYPDPELEIKSWKSSKR